MCKVYNTVGSLTNIKTHLTRNRVDGFHSVNELISFQNNYSTSRQQILSNQKDLVTEERNNLSSGVLQLEDEIAKSKSEISQKLQSEIESLRQQLEVIAESQKT